MKTSLLVFSCLAAVLPSLQAWDYEGHRIVNDLGLTSLPRDFPAFVRTPEAVERILFLAGEADRWRNSTNLPARHRLAPDHFFDIDDLAPYGFSPKTVSPFRYDFVAQLRMERVKHPEKFPALDPSRNTDHTRDLVGFLPWTINEHFAQLESAFSYLKTYEQFGGTPEEIANAQQNVIYIMGVMGHFAGDAAQPLHTTKHYNGWLGDNPKHFNTNKTIHSWIDGGFIRQAKIRADALKPKVRPARLIWPGGSANGAVFGESMQFIQAQFDLVGRVYELDRDGDLSPGRHDVTQGREFISAQLLKGGQFLGDLWYSAWQSARVDTFLRGELSRRANANAAK